MLALVYASLEIVSVLLLWSGVGAPATPPARLVGAAALPAHLAVLSLHPYLGYVYDRDENPSFSPHGFASETLYARTDDTLVVGIFGGSVADQLFVKRQVLAEELRKLPGMGQKRFLFANLALGGFKQPQQLLALTYMLALGGHFDVVINVDGFNEVTLPGSENIPQRVFPFYPRQWHWLTMNTLAPTQTSLIGKIALLQWLQEKVNHGVATFPLRYSMTVHLSARLFAHVTEVRLSSWRLLLQRAPLDTANLHYTQRGPEYRALSDEQMFGDLATMWERGSLQMRRVCEANGIRYFHFLQPNQYLTDTKAMSEEERRIAYREDQPYRVGVEGGYPVLREKGKVLSAQGVQFFDLTQIFTSHPEPVYGDSCCHFNDHGLEILNRFIGKAVVSHWEKNG